MVGVIEGKLGVGRMKKVDDELWAIIEKSVNDDGCLVHFITDSLEHLNIAFKKFGDRLCYGLNWREIGDTHTRRWLVAPPP